MGTQYNVMVGSDSSVFFARETSDVDGKLLDYITDQDGNIKAEYPVLERRTGHSLKGTTESIESAEIRKGRTKSAPRKGNSSSDGSLDIELSPASYDDVFEAALRGSWESFTSDKDDQFINKEGVTGINNGEFITKNSQGVYAARKLVGKKGSGALIENDTCDFEISQLKVGTEAHKFGAIVSYDGPDGALYQDFQHLAVNTMSLSVSPGQIVTGSFGFMGANDPKLEEKGDGYKVCDDASYNSDHKYFKKNDKGRYYQHTPDTAEQSNWLPSKYYLVDDVNPTYFTKTLSKRFANVRDNGQIRDWIDNLADVTENTKDQFTAREGFLLVNGREVDFGSNLTFELNNGLKQLYAIFRPDAVANPAMTLDVTGTLDTYLIKDHSEALFNYSVNDTDVELVWSFQDKEENPEDIYVFQLFKTKFDKDISSGSEELTVSLPYTSFEERAVRIFRLRKKTVDSIVADTGGFKTGFKVTLSPTTIGGDVPTSDVGLEVKVTNLANGASVTATAGSYSDGTKTYSFSNSLSAGKFMVEVTYNGLTYKKVYTVD